MLNNIINFKINYLNWLQIFCLFYNFFFLREGFLLKLEKKSNFSQN